MNIERGENFAAIDDYLSPDAVGSRLVELEGKLEVGIGGVLAGEEGIERVEVSEAGAARIKGDDMGVRIHDRGEDGGLAVGVLDLEAESDFLAGELIFLLGKEAKAEIVGLVLEGLGELRGGRLAGDREGSVEEGPAAIGERDEVEVDLVGTGIFGGELETVVTGASSGLRVEVLIIGEGRIDDHGVDAFGMADRDFLPANRFTGGGGKGQIDLKRLAGGGVVEEANLRNDGETDLFHIEEGGFLVTAALNDPFVVNEVAVMEELTGFDREGAHHEVGATTCGGDEGRLLPAIHGGNGGSSEDGGQARRREIGEREIFYPSTCPPQTLASPGQALL